MRIKSRATKLDFTGTAAAAVSAAIGEDLGNLVVANPKNSN
jgi:hypothetical protein